MSKEVLVEVVVMRRMPEKKDRGKGGRSRVGRREVVLCQADLTSKVGGGRAFITILCKFSCSSNTNVCKHAVREMLPIQCKHMLISDI